jgi:hypothetical protein
MDDLLKKALEFSNYQNTLTIQKKVLREKVSSQLTYGYNGGIFKIDQTLITFVQMLLDQGREGGIPLLDSNNTPIIVEDLASFRDEILDRYFTSLLDYHEKYQELKKNRSVEKLVGL